MKEDAMERNRLDVAHVFFRVNDIADQWMINPFEMRADLMRASGMDSNADQCRDFEFFDDIVFRNRFFSFLGFRASDHAFAGP